MAFAAEPLQEVAGARLDDGILRALWLTPTELQAEVARHRSPLVWKVVSDHLASHRFPLSLLRQVP